MRHAVGGQDAMRTVLPQVTAPWRFSMGAGAASTEAARAMVAMNEVYILVKLGASVEDDQVHERIERWTEFGTRGGVVTAMLMDE